MKNTYHFLNLFCIVILCTMCTESMSNIGDEIDLISSRLQNPIAIQLLQQMQRQPLIYEQMKEQSVENVISFEHTVISSSSQYGMFYAVPYTQQETIEGCFIIPIQEEHYKKLSIPINQNIQGMDNMSESERYFSSVQFLEWEDKGINTNPALSEYAKLVEKEDQKIENAHDLPFPIYSLPTTRGFYDEKSYARIDLEYKTTYTSFFDNNGYAIEVTAPNIHGIMEELKNGFERENCVLEAQVSHIAQQHLSIYVSFNEVLTVMQIKRIIQNATSYVTGQYFGNKGTVAFSSRYTYTYHINSNHEESNGKGSCGVSGAFQGGSHSGGGRPGGSSTGSSKKIKEATIECNDAIELQKSKAYETFSLLDKVEKDPVYQQYIGYADYLNAVSQRDSLEHATSLLEFEIDNDEKFYRCTPIEIGEANSVSNDTSSSNLVAIIHNHPNNTPPSFQDVITTASIAADSNKDKFKGCLVYSLKDKSYYMLYVYDREKAALFVSKYSKELDTETNWIKENGKFQNIINQSKKSFSKMSNNDSQVYTLALLLLEYDAGISIMQFDKDKIASALYCKETSKDLIKKRQRITPYKCQ
jgi:hypothetical protein